MRPPYHDIRGRDAMRRFYTTHEAAGLLGVSLPTVVNWIKARRIRAHRTPGGHRRIAREDLAAFMLRQGIPLPDELADAAPARRKALVVAEPGPPREGSARQLAAAGYAVEQVSPGFSAGVATARFEPDVVVLHALEPDGGDVLRALRSDREFGELPVVAIGHADWIEELVARGCSAALARPLADGALARAVEEALRGTNGPGEAPRPPARRASRPAVD
ncbi:MAG TPA: excisionase family DNA-binding protein [Anaeromyxobacteraceae bacterium]|nr:excisionase family DNA-binding protein [Anaeromyxobacteraceae bacterium]